VLDTSLRYTVDKTTREILFMPLPTAMKYRAKPFADVAVDRFAKGLGAALLIVAIKFMGFSWSQLSYVSIIVAALWIALALRARREYMQSFRRSLETRVMEVKELRLTGADLSTIETLIEELSEPDPARVVYAIDMLESLDKRNLVTPLLLYHESPDSSDWRGPPRHRAELAPAGPAHAWRRRFRCTRGRNHGDRQYQQ
jgi:hypothetical protein